MREIETDGAGRTESERFEQNVGGAARQIEHAIRWRNAREPDQAALPPLILPVRQEPRDQVVAVGDGREKAAHVTPLACRGGNLLAQRGAIAACRR